MRTSLQQLITFFKNNVDITIVSLVLLLWVVKIIREEIAFSHTRHSKAEVLDVTQMKGGTYIELRFLVNKEPHLCETHISRDLAKKISVGDSLTIEYSTRWPKMCRCIE